MKIKISKITSIILLISLFYYIPKTAELFSLLNSGITNGYFYWLAPINFTIIFLAILSLYSFKTNIPNRICNFIFGLNITGLLLAVVWFFVIYSV